MDIQIATCSSRAALIQQLSAHNDANNYYYAERVRMSKDCVWMDGKKIAMRSQSDGMTEESRTFFME